MPDCCGPMMMCVENEEHVTNGRSVCAEMMNRMNEGENPTDSCPMSAMFNKASGKRGFGLLAMIPGLFLVLVGVAIILEPQIAIPIEINTDAAIASTSSRRAGRPSRARRMRNPRVALGHQCRGEGQRCRRRYQTTQDCPDLMPVNSNGGCYGGNHHGLLAEDRDFFSYDVSDLRQAFHATP